MYTALCILYTFCLNSLMFYRYLGNIFSFSLRGKWGEGITHRHSLALTLTLIFTLTLVISRAHSHTYTHTHANIHTLIHTRSHTRTYTHEHYIPHTHTRIQTHTHTHIYRYSSHSYTLIFALTFTLRNKHTLIMCVWIYPTKLPTPDQVDPALCSPFKSNPK